MWFFVEWANEWTEEAGPENIIIELQPEQVEHQRSSDSELIRNIIELSRNRSTYSFESEEILKI